MAWNKSKFAQITEDKLKFAQITRGEICHEDPKQFFLNYKHKN